jgi:hypothetical protein
VGISGQDLERLAEIGDGGVVFAFFEAVAAGRIRGSRVDLICGQQNGGNSKRLVMSGR